VFVAPVIRWTRSSPGTAWSAVPLLAVVALVVTACGSSDGAGGREPAPTAPSSSSASSVPSSTTTPGTGTTRSSGTPGSGVVTGLVTLGPTRSVQRVGDPDPYEPVGQGTVVATSADGQEVGRAPIGADGRYRLEVGPGDLTVTATGTGAMRCDPVTVTVGAQGSVTADVRCDTGRR
jgi:hypothetical protein